MTTKPRRPWLAALLTVLTPGLGQLYSGHPRRGAAMLPVLWTALASWVLLCLYMEVPILRVGSFLLVAAFYLWIMVDAIRLARRAPADYELRRYNRSWVYALVVLIAAFALQPAFRGVVGSRIARAYSIPGTSMLPTLEPGDLFYMSPRAYPAGQSRRMA